MMALTVRQPWAWAIAVAGKDVENRSWRTGHLGLLAIHAGLAEDDPSRLPAEALRMYRTGGLQRPAAVLGGVVAVAELAGCHRHERQDGCGRDRWQSVDDDRCSDWAVPGQWHWELRDVRQLAVAVPCTGRLGLWHLPDPAVEAVATQIGGRA